MKRCPALGCGKAISLNKRLCLDCLAKYARQQVLLKERAEIDQQSMVNMLRDQAGVW